MSFDFEQAFGQGEAFQPSPRVLLGKGGHVVKITAVENTTSSGLYPMLKLKMENADGYQRDNLVISPKAFSVAKVTGLILSAGLPRPQAGVDFDPSDGRLSDEYAAKLVGKTVGIVNVMEEDREEKGKWWPRVKGYCDPAQVNTDTPADTAGLPQPGANDSSDNFEPDIPF